MDGTSGTAKGKTEVHGNIGGITLNHPATLNAAGQDRMAELGQALDGFVADPGVRAIVITGEGRGFCSGANLSAAPAAATTPGPPNGPNMALINVYNPF